MTDPSGIDRVRARSFGAAAANYDTYRPRYPDQLVDDVVAMTLGRRVLEVGAGTGIATAAFAARGLSMTCRRYQWTRRMPVVDYVERVNTTSEHLILPREVRDDLTAELIATLSGYGDELELAMTTELATGVRR